MMTFALITEGVSEYTVIHHLIWRYFRDDIPVINQIQPIDTDQSQQFPFNVSHSESGIEKTSDRLLADIVERLERNMPENIDKTRIIFAICIHTVECWLLPLVHSDNRKKKTKGCLAALNSELRRKNMLTVSETGDKNNIASQRAYREILKPLKKKSDIKKASEYNAGFQKFIGNLELLKI